MDTFLTVSNFDFHLNLFQCMTAIVLSWYVFFFYKTATNFILITMKRKLSTQSVQIDKKSSKRIYEFKKKIKIPTIKLYVIE